MTILKDIQLGFSNLETGRIVKIIEDSNINSWILKVNDIYGVAIEIDKEIVVNERFSNVRLYTKVYEIEGREVHLLILSSNQEHLRNEFARICRDFIEYGLDERTQHLLLTNPYIWWLQMKELMGNTNTNKQVTSILAEILCLNYLISNSLKVEWKGPLGSTIDIVTENHYYEIKSTIERYKSTVQISSQHQIALDKPQTLLFFRFEESMNGVSIDKIVKFLIKNGIEEKYIEERMLKNGLEKGSMARQITYKLLECQSFSIDENFPRITPESFKENKIPSHIEKITYDVDLTGLDKQNITRKILLSIN